MQWKGTIFLYHADTVQHIKTSLMHSYSTVVWTVLTHEQRDKYRQKLISVWYVFQYTIIYLYRQSHLSIVHMK